MFRARASDPSVHRHPARALRVNRRDLREITLRTPLPLRRARLGKSVSGSRRGSQDTNLKSCCIINVVTGGVPDLPSPRLRAAAAGRHSPLRLSGSSPEDAPP